MPSGLAVFLFLIVTGFYLLLSVSWNEFYKFSVLLHPVAGVINVIAFPAVVFFAGFRLSGRKTLAWLTVPIPIFALLTFLSAKPWLYMLFVSFYAVIYFLIVRRVANKTGGPEKGGFTLLAATYFAWLMVAATGLIILGWVNRSGVNSIYAYHRWWSVALLPLLVMYYLSPEASGADAAKKNRAVGMFRIVGVMFALIAMESVVFPPMKDVYKLHLSTVVLEKRTAEKRNFDPVAPVRKAGFDIVESCGDGAACHGEIVREHKLSAHNRTLWPAYFKKNLDEMSEEVGEHNTVICAGCHYPYGVIDREKKYTYFTEGNNCFSCTYCHLISDVKIGPGKGESQVSLQWHYNHIGMFLGEQGEKLEKISKLDSVMTSLNRTGHGRVFSRPLYKTGVYCMSCHMRFKQLNPHISGMKKATCIDCHMQPGEMIGFGKSRNNHFFPGASAHLPLFLGDEENYQRVKDYAEGRLGVNMGKGWRALWSVREKDEDKPSGNIPWLLMFYDFKGPVVPGKNFGFEVHSYNSTLAHPFPVASIDVLEAWMEVEAVDERGRVLFTSGGLDENKDVLPDSHELGGYMIGEDGHIITRNRVWQIKQKVIERDIPPGEKVIDEFSFEVPYNVSGNITFRAKWKYRKFNQDIMRWAYDGKITAPVLTIGEIEKTIPVEAGPENASGGAVEK